MTLEKWIAYSNRSSTKDLEVCSFVVSEPMLCRSLVFVNTIFNFLNNYYSPYVRYFPLVMNVKKSNKIISYYVTVINGTQ